MVSRRNRKIAPKRLGRKQTKKNWFQKLMYGGVVPSESGASATSVSKPVGLSKDRLLEKIQEMKANNQLIEDISKESEIKTGRFFYDIEKINKRLYCFRVGNKIYFTIKSIVDEGRPDDIPLLVLDKEADVKGDYFIIREVVYDKETQLYYLTQKRSNDKILDINVVPKSYDKSELAKTITSVMNVAPSGASAAVSGASASKAPRTQLKTASNEEMEELEKELANSDPKKLDTYGMVESVKKANAQTKKAMNKGKNLIAKYEKTKAIAHDTLKLDSEISELNKKIRDFSSLLRKKPSEFSPARISQIEAKITELKAKVDAKTAKKDEMLNEMLKEQKQKSFTGGATHKKNHKKRKHHPTKHTVKSK